MHAAMVDAKSSKDQAIGRGYGLKTSRNDVSGLDTTGISAFFAWSGNAYYLERSYEHLIGELPVSWKGAFIMMRVPIIVPPGFELRKFIDR
jgi:hypothetical protein